MTVSSTTAVDRYTGDDTSTVYNYSFRILDEGDILVQFSASGVVTTKTITTDYTVSGVGDAAGGAITFVTAPASTDTIVFSRNVAITQTTDYQENDTFPAESHEEALDRLTMIAQQIDEATDRTVKVDIATTGFDATLPVPTANGAIGFDSSGTGLTVITSLQTGDLVIGGSTNNGVMTFTDAENIGAEANLTFDGSTLAVTGAETVSGNLTVGGTVDIAGEIQHTGDTNNKIGFTTDTQTFTTGGTTRMDITNSGVKIGTGSRVTTVLDEDAMGTDSATALATQQSIKAYVDTQVASAGGVIAGYKTSNTSRSSTTTLTADPDLVVAVSANTDYMVKITGWADSDSTTPDIKFDFDAPAGAAVYMQGDYSSSINWSTGDAALSLSLGNTTSEGLTMQGLITVGGTAGNLSFRWAQNTSDATATTVFAGAILTIQQVS